MNFNQSECRKFFSTIQALPHQLRHLLNLLPLYIIILTSPGLISDSESN